MKEHLFKVMKSDLAIYGNLKTFTCPLCEETRHFDTLRFLRKKRV
jgi:hypothetical protein